jgi:hypothetical protein
MDNTLAPWEIYRRIAPPHITTIHNYGRHVAALSAVVKHSNHSDALVKAIKQAIVALEAEVRWQSSKDSMQGKLLEAILHRDIKLEIEVWHSEAPTQLSLSGALQTLRNALAEYEHNQPTR